jgi:D-glycero-alpha-D-manno-heptose-7-phosphate kinase
MSGTGVVLARAPLRLTLGGGGTDLPLYSNRFGGDVLTVAISLWVTVVASRGSLDGTFRYNHEETHTAGTAEALTQPYVREALRLTGMSTPCQITSLGPVPAGTGLGSSGAFSVSLIAALNRLNGRALSRDQLIEQACELEIDRLGMPIGKQDHYACALGGLRRLVIDTSGKAKEFNVPVDTETVQELERSLLLFYTGRRRDSAAHLARPGSALDLSRRVEQLHHIRKLGDQTRSALERGNLDEIAALLHEHWKIKRQRESSRWDEYLELARQHGAAAGKIVGAGGGGFLLLFAEPPTQCAVIAALGRLGLRHVPFRFVEEGLTVTDL